MVHMAFFLPQMVTWSDILVALDVYPRPTNASTQCCCAFLSIVTNGFRMFVVFTIDLFAYHGSLASDFRLSLVVWVGGVVVPSSSLIKKHEGTGQDLEVESATLKSSLTSLVGPGGKAVACIIITLAGCQKKLKEPGE